MNLGEIRDLTLKLVNSFSSDGELLTISETSDIRLAFNDFLNTGLSKFAEKDKIEAVYSVSQNPITNLLGDTITFDIVQHLDADISYTATGAKSYTFEVDKECIVYLEESISGVWTNLATLTITSISGFTEYKGLLTPSNVTNDVRIRFSGSYIYNIRNIALYAYSFASVVDIPQFRPWNKYALPSGYISTNRIVHNGDDKQRIILNDYYVDRGYFTVKRDIIGNFDIYYTKQPATLVLDTDIPEIQLQFHRYLAYFCAGTWLFTTGSQQNGLVLLNQFDSFLTEIKPNIDGSSNSISNDTGW